MVAAAESLLVVVVGWDVGERPFPFRVVVLGIGTHWTLPGVVEDGRRSIVAEVVAGFASLPANAVQMTYPMYFGVLLVVVVVVAAAAVVAVAEQIDPAVVVVVAGERVGDDTEPVAVVVVFGERIHSAVEGGNLLSAAAVEDIVLAAFEALQPFPCMTCHRRFLLHSQSHWVAVAD